MPKYIELEKALQRFEEIKKPKIHLRDAFYIDGVMAVLETIPTADVAPVVHGRWIESKSFEIGFWVCSNCGFVSEATAAPKLYNYCPNCGAKMDLEDDKQ